MSLTAPDGADLTPTGRKARGLLALLAEDPDMRRGRRWIESKLWSDRAPEQASGSLRQTLSEIRQALGPHADLMGADRANVWLDAARVETDLAPGSLLRAPHRELLEDIDVRDEAFEDWLRLLRARHDPTGPSPDPGAPPSGRDPGPQNAILPVSALHRQGTGLRIRTILSDTGSVAERVTSRVIADQMARGLEDRLNAARFAVAHRSGASAAADLEVRCDVAQDGDRAVIFARVEDGQDGRSLFSAHRTVQGPLSDAISSTVISGFVSAGATKVVRSLPALLDPDRPETVGLTLGNEGLDSLAAFRPEGFAEAHALFTQAYEADANPLHLAWRAFVRMAQILEMSDGGDSRPWLEEIGQLSAASLQQAPGNSLAVALIALTRIMLEDDLDEPARLAMDAMNADANNLFARQTLAVAHSAVGDANAAYALSKACETLRQDDPLSHLWDLYHALVCISAGRLTEARASSERSLQAAPGFVAPRRQLIALCAHAGDIGEATRFVDEMTRIESGFSLSRMLDDPDYPVLTLRRAGLIDTLRKKLPKP